DEIFRGDEMFTVLRELLPKKYPGIKFVDYTEFGNTTGRQQREVVAALPEKLKQHKCDAVISGVGA
ncbi:MAG: UGSC family (seleno)protein, partial [Chloroflexota bacterium]